MSGMRCGLDENSNIRGVPFGDDGGAYVGEFKYFGFETVPEHCLACDGCEVSRETYSELFTVFGETFGAGDGATTFNLPDLRGVFLRCIGGNAAALGVEQGDAIQDITGQFEVRATQDRTDVTGTVVNLPQDGGAFLPDYPVAGGPGYTLFPSSTVEGTQKVNFAASNLVSTAAEVRPINVAVNICVVYE